ncbi:MAG: hypothetical protein AAF526_07835 [Pseudomonadota bacterium]
MLDLLHYRRTTLWLVLISSTALMLAVDFDERSASLVAIKIVLLQFTSLAVLFLVVNITLLVMDRSEDLFFVLNFLLLLWTFTTVVNLLF